MKPVMADGDKYDNHYEAAKKLNIHKDTVIYRIKAKSKNWEGWYYVEKI